MDKNAYLEKLRRKFDFKSKVQKIKNDYKESVLYSWILTFTKKVVVVVLVFTLFYVIFATCLLAYAYLIRNVETSLTLIVDLSQSLIRDLAVIILGYLGKALFETKFEKDNERKEKEIQMREININECNNCKDDKKDML